MAKSYSLRPLWLFGLLLLLCAFGIALQSSQSEAGATGGTGTANVGGAGGGHAVPLFDSLPSWGPDIRVITDTGCLAPGGDSPDVGWQIEKNFSLATSPLDPNFVVGGYELGGNYCDTHSRFVASTDGGYTWRGGNFAGQYFGDLELRNDSLVAFDSHGVAYYAGLAGGSNSSGYIVFTSTDGLTWNRPHQIAVASYSDYRDLADFAIDRNSPGSEPYAGSLYFASPYYQAVPPYDLGLHLRYSRDNGVTWSSDEPVSDPDTANNYYYRPSVKVASNGIVYVGFTEIITGSVYNSPRLYLDKSTDGGQSWGTDQLITGAPIYPIGASDWKYHERTLVDSAGCSLVRINHNPIIGVSPSNPNEVYVVWNDGRWDLTEDLCERANAQHSDIAFSRTTDGGATWSAPVRINDDPQGNGIDQWQPTMEVAPDGTIGVTWYDRRYSTDHHMYDLAYSQSTDGGLTWSPNQRVTDQSSDGTQLNDNKGIDDLGFRRGMVFGSDYLLSSWIDTRDGLTQGHLYVDHGIFLSPTPGPSPTKTSSPTPTSLQATPSATSTSMLTSTATSMPQLSSTPVPSATPTACAIDFTDVPVGSTFYPYIHCLACLGIINGYPDDTFKPNNSVTRGQLSKIVSNAADFSDNQTTQTFQDVPSGSTFFQFIGRLASRGFISGYPCGGSREACIPPANLPYFRPTNNSTRGQISKIVSNAAGFSDAPTGQQFEDVPAGSTYYTYTYRLVTRGVMSGYACGGAGEPCIPPASLPYFRPNNNATRGQVSKIVANTFFPNCNPHVQ